MGKSHPILFTGEMVRAILEGRKTQTRRPIKGQSQAAPDWTIFERPPWAANDAAVHGQWREELHAPFAVGDRLWVRETWGLCTYGDPTDFYRGSIVTEGKGILDRYGIEYRAAWGTNQESAFWRPSILMPRWASRLTLEVTGIRPERVKDITVADAIAEGGPPVGAVFGFACLWDGIYGKGPLVWTNNPWTWATTFKVVTP